MKDDIPTITVSVCSLALEKRTEMAEVEKTLLYKAGVCTVRKESETKSLMQIAGVGYVYITTDYNPKDFGFSPNELVMFPDRTINLCVGITDGDLHPNVWFVSKHTAIGIIHWPGINNKDYFIKEGFSRVQIVN